MKPEDALERARAAAAARDYPDEGPIPLVAAPVEEASHARLTEWSLVEPDLDRVYSTRSGGRAITWAKRRLAHALRQYIGSAFHEQSRYNALATTHILDLERRVRELEAKLAERDK